MRLLVSFWQSILFPNQEEVVPASPSGGAGIGVWR